MKNKSLLLVGCFLALVSGLVSAQERPKDNTITVSGSSTIQLAPDEIILSIGISEHWIDEKETEKVVIAEVEKKVLEALKKGGVKNENVTHSEVSLTRDYDRNKRRYTKRALGKSLYVCVYSADEIAKVLSELETSGLLERGVTAFRIAELRHTKKEEFEQKAKLAAIKDAKAKAELLVGALGKNLGDIVTIEEGGLTQRSRGEGSFYETANHEGGGNTSGVSPISISYRLKAAFAIR